MATIQFGSIITDARGKLNGSQLSKNRAGSILQNKCGQRKGATVAQSVFRSQFSTLARFWRTLTEEQQVANNSASVNYPYTDKYGNTRYFTGYQLLLRSNINRYVSGLSPITEVPATPPTGFDLSDIVGSSVVVSPGTADIALTWNAPSAPPTAYSAQIFFGNQVSAGIQNYSGGYLFSGSLDAGEGEFSVDQTTYPPCAFLSPGNAIFTRIAVIHTPSGVEVANYVVKIIISSL